MRPVSVTMVGFGTFSDPVTVDFEDLDVFALVGPTGSGKSTVIDAICFALYGTIPRYDDRRAVGPAVSVRAAEARVSLTFELGGTRYVAVRVVRKDAKGKASTKEARLERADGEVLAGTAREMESVVPELLGLGFEQFTRAVVLPQGEFARFLHDKPAARQDLLVQLLGLDVYERMMQRARVLRAETTAGLARDQHRIEELAGATVEAQAAGAARVQCLAELQSRGRTLKPELDAATAEAERADAEARAAQHRARRLKEIAAPEGVPAAAERIRRTEAALAAAEQEVERLAAAVTTADAEAPSAADRERWGGLRDAHRLVESLTSERAPLVAALTAVTVEATAAADAAGAAERHRDELRTANAAHVVREHLVLGDPCPVCEQTVARIPSGEAPAEWRVARVAADDAVAHAAAVAKRLARAEHAIEELDGRLERARTVLTDAPDADHIAAEIARLDAQAATAVEVRTAEQAARAAARRARDARDEAGRAAAGFREAHRSERDALVGLGLVPPNETDDLAADWEALRAWAAEELVRHGDEVTATTERAAAVRAAWRERWETLAAEAVALDLDVDAGARALDQLLETVAVESRVAQDAHDRIGLEIAEREALLAAVAERATDAEVAGELARLLDANHFERWLVSEAMQRLVEGGSERLRELSDGRYSFAFDDSGRDLLVVDHGQGDEQRSVRTLSGGETFQASLALALALSDQLADLAADGAARLESIFLDEGFGTLDAETLETVATTIENLAAVDRMVGIVTHVPELAARMPVQFRVTKGARSSHVERVVT